MLTCKVQIFNNDELMYENLYKVVSDVKLTTLFDHPIINESVFLRSLSVSIECEQKISVYSVGGNGDGGGGGGGGGEYKFDEGDKIIF